MKLKNKISGEIKEFALFDGNELQGGATLESLMKEWEDAPEEPKGIKSVGNIGSSVHIEMGSKEEAEKAVEKLKAWKRLKDKGFRFEGWQDLEACDEIERMITNRIIDGENIIGFRMDDYHDCYRDLNICFGGDE